MAWPCERDQTATGDFEDGGRRPPMEICSQPLEARKGKEIDFPLKPPERDTSLPTAGIQPRETLPDF